MIKILISKQIFYKIVYFRLPKYLCPGALAFRLFVLYTRTYDAGAACVMRHYNIMSAQGDYPMT